MAISINTTLGRDLATCSSASRPSPASPTTSIPGNSPIRDLRLARMSRWSSHNKIRIGFIVPNQPRRWRSPSPQDAQVTPGSPLSKTNYAPSALPWQDRGSAPIRKLDRLLLARRPTGYLRVFPLPIQDFPDESGMPPGLNSPSVGWRIGPEDVI